MEDEDRRWYIQTLPAKADALAAALGALARPGQAQGARETIRRLAHGLRGSGGTYGISRISVIAAAAEEAHDGELPRATARLIETLRKIVDDAGRPRPRVLVVDDDVVLARRIAAAATRGGCDAVVVTTGRDAEVALGLRVAPAPAPTPAPVPARFDLVVLDLVLPDADGRRLLARLREQPRTATLPVVVLTDRAGPLLRAECSSLGADDYFEKPVDPDLLAATMAARLARQRELTHDARTDSLTGLPNRAAFCEAYERAAALAGRGGEPLSVAILDVDHFKGVNDGHGHAAGDEVLRRVAAALRRSLRATDVVARWGGDELVALLPRSETGGAARALRQACAAAQAEVFTGGGGATFKVTLSAGVAPGAPDARVDDVMAEADRHLYRAKAAGRARVMSPPTRPRPPRGGPACSWPTTTTTSRTSWSSGSWRTGSRSSATGTGRPRSRLRRGRARPCSSWT